jgi:hypothetical protein
MLLRLSAYLALFCIFSHQASAQRSYPLYGTLHDEAEASKPEFAPSNSLCGLLGNDEEGCNRSNRFCIWHYFAPENQQCLQRTFPLQTRTQAKNCNAAPAGLDCTFPACIWDGFDAYNRPLCRNNPEFMICAPHGKNKSACDANSRCEWLENAVWPCQPRYMDHPTSLQWAAHYLSTPSAILLDYPWIVLTVMPLLGLAIFLFLSKDRPLTHETAPLTTSAPDIPAGRMLKWLIETRLKIQLFFVGLHALHRRFFPAPILPSPEELSHTAQQHLKNAMAYFDKWLNAKDWNDKRNFVRFAAQQIELAKKYDHTAKLDFIDQDKQPDTWDIKQFSATALFYQAQNDINDRCYGHAARVLNRALEFDPDNTQYLNKLAQAHILNRSRRLARSTLKKIQYPDIRTTELQDRLQADWFLGSTITPHFISAVLGVASLAAAFYLFDKNQWSNWLPIILGGFGWLCLWNAKQGSLEDTVKRQGKWPGKTRADHEL